MALTEDLSLFLADFGQSATLNASAVTAIVDTNSEIEVEGLVTQAPTALLRSSDASSAAPGQAFVSASVTYTVRQVLREAPDGAFTRLVLARA